MYMPESLGMKNKEQPGQGLERETELWNCCGWENEQRAPWKKAGLLQGRGSQPQKCPGERRKMKLGSGKEGFVVSCFGINGLFRQEQSHPCCLSSNSCLQAGEMSHLWGMTEGGGNLGVGWDLLALHQGCGSPWENGVCLLSPLLNSYPTAALPKAGRMSPEQQKSVLMKAQDWFCWKKTSHLSVTDQLWWYCGRFWISSSSMSLVRRPVWEFDSKFDFSL